LSISETTYTRQRQSYIIDLKVAYRKRSNNRKAKQELGNFRRQLEISLKKTRAMAHDFKAWQHV